MAVYNRHTVWAYAFVIPQLLITVLFFIVPALRAIYQSFFFGDPFGLSKRAAFLQNYLDLLADPGYLKSFWVTALLAVSITFTTTGLGLLLAVLVAKRTKGTAVYKTMLIWPYAVAPAIAAVLWKFICQPDFGWLSRILHYLGIHYNYLVNANQALATIILSATWQQFSFNFLFFFAALKGLPKTLLEAAEIDGASRWWCFWTIVFPLISPTTFFLFTMNIIYSFFDTFGMIDVLTRGGPSNSTTTLIYKVYQDGFQGLDVSSSAAQSVVMMFLVIGLMFIQFRYIEKKVHYQ